MKQISTMDLITKHCLITIEMEDEPTELHKRGLIPTNSSGLEINANIFASYLMKRMTLIQLPDEKILVYSNTGLYIKLDMNVLKTICRNVLHEAKSNIWKRKWENEYIEALKREIPRVEQLNADKDHINLKNGMLNLYTMEFCAHAPSYLSTIQIPIEFNKDAICPKFDSFLNDIFEEDHERILLIQELMGYCFLAENKIQKAFFFLGSGSNGKSVLAEIIRKVVGIENVSTVALKDINGRFGMQNLPNKLVNISTENEFDKKFNTQYFKILTSGDATDVEIKYQNSFSTILFAKMIVLLNSMMDSKDLTEGFFRRVQIIPFNRKYYELHAGEEIVEHKNYMDKHLTEKLLQELSGILNFAMAGLSRLFENDFKLTKSTVCESAKQQYRLSQNPIPEYFNSRVLIEEQAITRRSNFRDDFLQWAAANGLDDIKSIGSKRFWDLLRPELSERGIKIREPKLDGNYHIEGLAIKE